MRLLRTYTTFAYVCVRLLHMLCGFCVPIRNFVRVERLCIRIRLICCDFWCRPHDSLKFSMIRSWGFFDLLLSMWTLVICCKSGRSDLEGPFIYFSARAVCYCWTISRIAFLGSVKFFFCASCSLWLDRLKDPILRVPSSSFSENLLAIHRQLLPQRFRVDLDRAIYTSRWSNITVHYIALW